MPQKKLKFRLWYEKALQDIDSAEVLINNGFLQNAIFLCQQAIEKTLKGALLNKGWKLVRTHNLALLEKELKNYGVNLSEFTNAFMELTAAYLEQRYPMSIEFEEDEEFVRSMIDIAREIYKRLCENT